MKVIDKFKVGINPHHVVPSWDMKKLWVANNAGGPQGRQPDADRSEDRQARQGNPGRRSVQHVLQPDGKSAIVVAEAYKRLDFRDPHTMAMQYSIPCRECAGINHADFSIDGRYAIFTCEFAGTLVKIDLVDRKVVGYLKLKNGKMPQDIRIAPDGKHLLRRRHEGGRHVHHRRRRVQGERVRADRRRHARPLPEP